jgi:uncharacterized protein
MAAESASQPADVGTEDVAFYSGPALRMAGRIFHPPGQDGRPLPGVVFCHGTGGVKEESPPGMARLLAKAGYRVLTWDYRGFGGSEGFRGRLVPAEQIEDTASAAEYFAHRRDIDHRRVALYGTSMGGRMAAGALLQTDAVRCAVLVVPAVFAGRRETGPPTPEQIAFQERARAALLRKIETGQVEIVERNEIIKNPQTAQRYAGKSYPMALEMVAHLGKGIHPVHWAPFIKQPVLVIAMEHDGQIPLEAVRQFHAGLAGDKKLHLFSTGNHYSVYDEMLEDTFKVAREWLDSQLRA